MFQAFVYNGIIYIDFPSNSFLFIYSRGWSQEMSCRHINNIDGGSELLYELLHYQSSYLAQLTWKVTTNTYLHTSNTFLTSRLATFSNEGNTTFVYGNIHLHVLKKMQFILIESTPKWSIHSWKEIICDYLELYKPTVTSL